MAQYQEGQVFTAPGQPPLVYRGGRFVSADASPAAPAPPAFIPGPTKQVDPAEEERLRLARNADARSAETNAREQAKFTAEQQAKAAGGGIEATADQRKAAGFYQRAVKADKLFGGMNFQPRDAGSQMLADTLPKDVVNSATSPERQTAETYMRDFIMATLRQESGAAISAGEIENQKRTFFPQPGDSPEAIRAKALLRQHEIEALRLGAGPAAALVSPEIQSPQLSQEQVNARVGEMLMQGKSRDEIAAFVKSTGRDTPPDFLKAVDANIGNLRPDVRTAEPQMGDGMRKFLVGTGDVVQAAGNAVGLVANPLNAGLNMTGIPQAITGEPLGTDFGQSLRDTLGFPRPQGSTEELVSKINQGAAMGLGMAGAARAAAPAVQGVIGNALARFGSQPLVDTVAGGSGAGSGEVARRNGAGPLGQLGASLLGGGLVVAPASRANAFLEGAPAVENALVRAGKQEGVTVNRAMIDPATEGKVTGVESTMAGGPMVRAGMNNVRGQIEGRVQDLGRGGEALTQDVAGSRILDAAQRHIANTGKQFRALYNRAEQLAGGVKLDAPNANAQLDDMIARLSETGNTNASEIAYLNSLKADLSKPISVGALRDLRTTLRQKISKGDLVFGQNEARVLGIMDALSQDIEGGLRAADKGRAADAFKNADAGYRDRMAFIQGTIQKIIGKREQNLAPGTVFQNFKNMAAPKGDLAGFAKMLRTMDPEEQADIAATFADALGKNKGGDFSTAQFITQVGQLPRAARVNLFGPEGAKSIDNLLMLAKEHKRVVGAFNASKTGRTNDYRSWLTNLLLGGGGGASISALTDGSVTVPALVGAAATTLAKGARDILNARTLLSPDIAKWAANAPKTAEAGAINRHFDQLAKIAARNPGLKDEVAQIQQAIMRAANENMQAAAAKSGKDQQDDSKKRQPQTR